MARRIGTLGALMAALLPVAPASAQTGATQNCPATFEVLHDDRIGSLVLSKGNYRITVRGGLGCSEASGLFREFLEDWDGRLPRPWTTNAATRTFTRGSTGISFTVTRVLTPSGGGGGGRHPATGATCPAYFSVLHNDRIGALRVPQGSYTITVLSHTGLSCARASRLFARFLQDFDGILPRPWVLDPETATFFGGSSRVAFRVEPAVGPAPVPSGGGTLPSSGRRCPGTFDVEHNDRIGRLRLPGGPYIVTRLSTTGGPSCSRASRLFTRFLSAPNGRLPRPWRLQVATGTFTRGSSKTAGFRVKPVRRVR